MAFAIAVTAAWPAPVVASPLDSLTEEVFPEAVLEVLAVAEDEAAYEDSTQAMMEVPRELVPAVRELLAKRRA